MMKKSKKSPTLQTVTRVELFEQLLDAFSDPVLVKDCAGHYVWGNRAKLKELGVTDLSKIIGKTVDDFFDRAAAEGFKSDDDRVVQTGQPITDLREKIAGPDGTVCWHLTNKIPWRDSGGKILGLIAVSRDITSLVEAEAKFQEERNLLRTLVDNLPDGVYAKDVEGRKVMVNPSDLKVLGCRTEAEAIGKTDFDFFPREIAEQFVAAEMPVLKNGTPLINHEEMISLPGGERRWILTSKIPWRDASGKVIGLVGIGRDIHDQKVAEMNLQEERNLLRTLINHLPDPIYAKDVASRKIVANQGDLKNLGCSDEAEAIGKTDFDFFPKEIAEAFFADDQIVLKEGKAVINREEKMVSKDGRTRWLLTSKIPWRDAAGKIIGLIGIGRDITDKKELEAQIAQAQRMESIGRVATGIAHDLNNILTPILISIEILRAKLQDEEYLKMLAKAEASAHRGADILKQMLWFSRGLNGHHGPVNLQQLTGDIAQFTTETFGKSIHVEKQIAADLGTVNGDSAQLHQVLMSLCSNARDAMPKGGALRIVAHNADVDGRRYVVLEVADTGMGIAPELANRIFEPFFTTKAVGHGLGLSTAHSIVKGHRGFIKVESQPGHGATFRVYLPVQL